MAENLAFRNFDVEPHAVGGWLVSRPALRRSAERLIERYNIKPPDPDRSIQSLSGGNVQRAVLARELSADVEILIITNPCFGLDFRAMEEIRQQIVAARNRGTAVLLVSEDLDEILELSDRTVVMFNGQLVYETTSSSVDLALIGQHMTGHTI